ncbi:MAG TPA: hypothetical protein VF145_01030 [Chitinophagaceae bacterium]
MKKLFIAAIAIVALATTAVAADGGKNVNYWVLSKFNNSYKAATNVNWVVTSQYAKATFLLDGERVEAYYSTEGEFIAESKAIATQDLPRMARKTIEKKYSGYTLKEVIEYATPEKTEYYVSMENEKESKILKISSGGEIEVFKTLQK